MQKQPSDAVVVAAVVAIFLALLAAFAFAVKADALDKLGGTNLNSRLGGVSYPLSSGGGGGGGGGAATVSFVATSEDFGGPGAVGANAASAGTPWAQFSFGDTALPWQALAWNGTTWVALSAGNDYSTSTSATGTTWALHSNVLPATATNWQYVGVGGSTFCAIGGSATSTFSATSTTGATWTGHTVATGTAGAHGPVANNGTTWALLSTISGSDQHAFTSSDCSTWSAATISGSFTSPIWMGMVWNGSLFCATATQDNSMSATSPTGATWTLHTSGANNFGSVAWNGTTFCSFDLFIDQSYSSTDCINWTAHSAPASGGYTSIAWNGAVFEMVSSTTVAATSADCVTWTAQTMPNQSWESIAGHP